MNKLLVDTLETSYNSQGSLRQYHDLDDLFGTWNEDEYRRITQGLEAQRTIDSELWQ